jgi:hypothetical protein
MSVPRSGWWPGAESNCRHRGFQPRALPTELPGRFLLGAGDGLRSRDLRLDRAVRTPDSSTPANIRFRAPNGIRTRASALKGRRPGPLDDGGLRLPVIVRPGWRPTEYSGAIWANGVGTGRRRARRRRWGARARVGRTTWATARADEGPAERRARSGRDRGRPRRSGTAFRSCEPTCTARAASPGRGRVGRTRAGRARALAGSRAQPSPTPGRAHPPTRSASRRLNRMRRSRHVELRSKRAAIASLVAV